MGRWLSGVPRSLTTWCLTQDAKQRGFHSVLTWVDVQFTPEWLADAFAAAGRVSKGTHALRVSWCRQDLKHGRPSCRRRAASWRAVHVA